MSCAVMFCIAFFKKKLLCAVLCFVFIYMHICMYLWLYNSIYLLIWDLVFSAYKSPKSPPHVLPTDIGDRKCTDDGFGLGAWNRKGSYEPSTSWLIVSPSVPRCVKWTHTCFFFKTPTSFLGLEHVELSHIVTNPPPQHLLQPSVSSCQVID